MSDDQPALFDLPPPQLAAATPRAADIELAARLPAELRLGTMSWSYPAWANLVYAGSHSTAVLAEAGLTAYAKHPLLRAVEIDRSYYGPLPSSTYRAYADQTPADFRFLVKAHEDCTVQRYPLHARYGKKAGERNALYLDAAYAIDHVVAPLVEGLGPRAFALLFQFPPQELEESPDRFAARLHRFLEALPPAPFAYAVELRNAERFVPAYGDALVAAGAIHCHNVWPGAPPLLTQVAALPPATRRPLLVRWLMRKGDTYETASARAKPFGRLVLEDPENLAAVARLVRGAAKHDVPALVAVDNKAEGCAPATIARLARLLDESPSAR